MESSQSGGSFGSRPFSMIIPCSEEVKKKKDNDVTEGVQARTSRFFGTVVMPNRLWVHKHYIVDVLRALVYFPARSSDQ